MPPRSVCLNVFTTSLGHGKEAGVSVREVDGDVAMTDRKEEGPVGERGRHDSVQSSPNDSIATTPSYIEPVASTTDASPITSTEIDISTLSNEMGCCVSAPRSSQNIIRDPTDSTTLLPSNLIASHAPTLTCFTCDQPPAEGTSLQRCSRCKRAFYCSKACQKSAWKFHKLDCGSSSALHTPDISTPGSPANSPARTTFEPDRNVFLPLNSPVDAPQTDISMSIPARRYPQSTADWTSGRDYMNKVNITFDEPVTFRIFQTRLADAYRLWVCEHGGVAPNEAQAESEFRDYLHALGERVNMPVYWNNNSYEQTMAVVMAPKNHPRSESFDVRQETTRDEIREKHGETILAEFDAVTRAVYGRCAGDPQTVASLAVSSAADP